VLGAGFGVADGEALAAGSAGWVCRCFTGVAEAVALGEAFAFDAFEDLPFCQNQCFFGVAVGDGLGVTAAT
jgi:hypothetical protein